PQRRGLGDVSGASRPQRPRGVSRPALGERGPALQGPPDRTRQPRPAGLVTTPEWWRGKPQGDDGPMSGIETLDRRHAGTASAAAAPMIDPFGRTVSYLRVSVTDRCDFRCAYCMSEHMTF